MTYALGSVATQLEWSPQELGMKIHSSNILDIILSYLAMNFTMYYR